MAVKTFNPSRPINFFTIDFFYELSYFDIFLHMDVLETFNFNFTKVKTTLSRMHDISFEKY